MSLPVLTMRSTRPKMDQIKALMKRDTDLEGVRKIAKTVGCSPGLVWMVRKEMGLPMFKRGGRRRWVNPEIVEKARRLKVAGWTYAAIGKHLELSPSTIGYYMKIAAKRDGSCERCGKPGLSLHCHHISYEDDTQFELLCPSCHTKEHRPLDKYRESLR